MGRERRLNGEGTRFVFSIEVEMLKQIDKHLIAQGYMKRNDRAGFIRQAIAEKLKRNISNSRENNNEH